ncbi:hypothetical protein ABT282_07155 [Streptomyces sp. NPDC000927]|uniref:hypothetical protein n=1 Tax=Streptomyces sp. NPDC000927 TaxID=3154371 RepID=UPI003332E56D
MGVSETQTRGKIMERVTFGKGSREIFVPDYHFAEILKGALVNRGYLPVSIEHATDESAWGERSVMFVARGKLNEASDSRLLYLAPESSVADDVKHAVTFSRPGASVEIKWEGSPE